ncbi:hypothetical protein X560_2161 [Listeria fleischmannii 1991]|uniref:DUF4870 domain-containing protein n=2 Tax=Listeria fleischmannii TaxID=1069827 RepID=A0A2X3H1D1_9LIST|nr:DUF4870 domain-containing protein [Listeria fleischmannii]EMG26840.1 hypothetical protein LFLEISCH_14332 [Listeria fleischmannii subsp. fleischmannii LU2006-1]KMT58335.1 hypothetical protein X560_2161 [Listeria fleischmannii 1991]SQC66177.1 Uncharacterised protein [Listeria fleischmannii subsp. fleischmannii]
MNNHKIVNALSYFSILFAPVLVPLFIWVFGESRDVKHHSKVALFTHILPTISIFFTFCILSLVAVSTDSSNTVGFIAFGAVVVLIILTAVLFLFNLIQGVRMLVGREEDAFLTE